MMLFLTVSIDVENVFFMMAKTAMNAACMKKRLSFQIMRS